MDALNRLYARMVGALAVAPPRARLIAAMAAMIVMVGLAYVVRREAVGETTYLLGGQTFSTAEMTAIQAALGEAKLSDFTVEGNRISIPRKKQAAYLAALADAHALPQTLDDVLSEGVETPSLIMTRQSQLEKARVAKKRGLSLILRSIENVESAEVDFDRDEPRGLKQERVGAALVAIKLRGGQPLTEGLAKYFQTIAAADLNMSPRDVTVVDKTNHIAFGGRDSRAPDGTEDYHDLKRKYQAYYEETVRKALAYVPGITVSADVELNGESQGERSRADLDANRAATVHADLGQATGVGDSSDEISRRETMSAASATILKSLLPLEHDASKAAALQNNRPHYGQDATTACDRLAPREWRFPWVCPRVTSWHSGNNVHGASGKTATGCPPKRSWRRFKPTRWR